MNFEKSRGVNRDLNPRPYNLEAVGESTGLSWLIG